MAASVLSTLNGQAPYGADVISRISHGMGGPESVGELAGRMGLDWHGFELTPTTRGAVTCSGGILYSPGTQRPVYRTLAYGKTWTHGGFTCASATNGLTCRNRKGHGLFIARESWRAW